MLLIKILRDNHKNVWPNKLGLINFWTLLKKRIWIFSGHCKLYRENARLRGNGENWGDFQSNLLHMWMCQINHQFSPMKPRCRLRYVGNVFFSFQCTINDENRWLNTKIFLKGDIIALKRQYVYSAILWHTVYCRVIQRLVTSDQCLDEIKGFWYNQGCKWFFHTKS